jgi:carboxymethylenebutenolidase
MGSMIELTAADGFKFGAYKAEPVGKPRGGLVVVMEIFGANSHIRSVADGYAADGYLVIAPAMFDRVQPGFECGYTPPEIEVARGLMQKAKLDDAIKDVEAAVAALQGAGKVGIVGYCWGGTVAWKAAAEVAGIACSAPHYGGGIPNHATLQAKCPVAFHWGEKDQSIPLEAAQKVQAAQPGCEHFFYAAGHGFNCDQRPSYDAASSKLSRERTLAMLHKYVG